MHRKGKPSQYTWENVAIVPGGRAGLIRIAAVLNNAYVGFFIPDYTGTHSSSWFWMNERSANHERQRTTKCSRCSRTYGLAPTSPKPEVDTDSS
jgi:hypothetical protein